MKNAKIFGSGVSRRTFGLHQHMLKVQKIKADQPSRKIYAEGEWTLIYNRKL